MKDITDDINAAAKVIIEGGIILYPTDTIWGLGCDATNNDAIKKIFALKKREEKKSMIILLDSIERIRVYVNNPPKKIFNFLSEQKKPTTAIFNEGMNLGKAAINADGTIAIRVVKDIFCQMLIQKSGAPLISTSANISGENYPGNYEEISIEIKNGVDYIVQHRQKDLTVYEPSSIIKLDAKGEIINIR